MNRQVPWEFDKHKAVLLVIDMQNDFVKEGAIMEVPKASVHMMGKVFARVMTTEELIKEIEKRRGQPLL
jgi:nicotinamidase-related amidase